MSQSPGFLLGARRRIARAHVASALIGLGDLPRLDLAGDANSAIAELLAVLRGAGRSSSLLWSIRGALVERGDIDRLLDGLAGPDANVVMRCARLAGALRLEEAVLLLGRLLRHDMPPVRAAAARALGTIAGAQSADALVRALYWRRGAARRIVLELAKAAPDHYLRNVLADPEFSDIRQHIVLAIGLRGDSRDVAVLVAGYDAAGRSERSAVCRALGWIGDAGALPLLAAALEDDLWQVRVSALKAVARVGDRTLAVRVERLTTDPYPEVRRAAESVLRRFGLGTPAATLVPSRSAP